MTQEVSAVEAVENVEPVSTAVESAPAPSIEAVEKQVPQTTMNDIVGSVRQKAYAKGREEALAELERNKTEQAPATTQAVAPVASHHGHPSMSKDDISAMISDQFKSQQEQANQAAAQAQQEKYVSEVYGQLVPKIKAAEEKYADFNDVTLAVDLPNEAPELLFYANGVDNSGDVLYNLAKNPAKIGALKALSPRLAQLEIQRLSKSLKQNESATGTSMPREPLSQIKTSNIGGDSGKRSLKDLREYYKSRT